MPEPGPQPPRRTTFEVPDWQPDFRTSNIPIDQPGAIAPSIRPNTWKETVGDWTHDTMAALAGTLPGWLGDKLGLVGWGEQARRLEDARLHAEPLYGDAGAPVRGIRAFHGSPYDFDRFDISKIGTGQGAQTYGHGLYFAEAEPVAAGYRSSLSSGLAIPDDILARYFKPGEIVKGYGGRDRVLEFRPAASPGGRWEVRVQRVDASGNVLERDPISGLPERPRAHATSPSWDDVRDAFELRNQRARARGLPEPEPPWAPGRSYEVRLNVDPDQLLHFDKPFAEQSPHVQDALTRLGVTPGDPALHSPLRAETGADLYRQLANRFNDPNAWVAKHEPAARASAALDEAGVPGHRYYDQFSRNRIPGDPAYLQERVAEAQQALDAYRMGGVNQSGARIDALKTDLAYWQQELAKKYTPPTHNIVMYHDKLVDIMRKYGILPPLVAGGALSALTSGTDSDHVGTPPPVR